MDLKNKNVVVTGAASGIGIGFIQSFKKRGARLILVDINDDGLKKAVSDYLDADTLSFVVDIGDHQARLDFFEEMKRREIEVDVLVNNVGIGYRNYLADESWERLQKVIDINTVGCAHMCWLFLPQMKKRNSGAIINLASTGSFLGADTGSVYTGTKAFVMNFTEGLSMELMGTNVRVLSAHPGATATNFWEDSGWKNSDYFEKHRKMSPEATAEEFVSALEKGRTQWVAGFRNRMMVRIAQFIPRNLLKSMAVKKYK